MPSKNKKWMRLDNAALLYSAIQKETYSAVYRFSAVLHETVDPNVLQRAIDLTMPRFPGFRSRMRRGMFWYYLEPMDIPGPMARPDIANPCQPLRLREGDGWLVRVFFYHRRISVEVFHAVSDGAGTLVFFRTLLATYFRLLGHPIPNTHGILDIDQPPQPQELEDAYARYAGPVTLRGRLAPKAYAINGTPEPFYTLHYTMGRMPVDKLLALSRRCGVSMTEYLAAVLIQVLLDRQEREKPRKPRPVSLTIPINLRSHFPSQTLRNFILTTSPSIDPRLGRRSFEEILSQVHHYIRLNLDRTTMQARLTGNVAFQRNLFLQLIPLFLKNPVLGIAYQLTAVRPFTTTYTNPGPFRVPPEMEPLIDHMEVMLGQPYGRQINCASISYGNTLAITFAGTIAETDIERDFFRFLVRAGIPVRVDSNRTS